MDDPPRVLYVRGYASEDEVEDRLVGEGLDVHAVVGTERARTIVTDLDFDCVVTRYEVPWDDGIEFQGGLAVLQTLRETHPELPVILFTEIENRDVAKEASVEDLFDYIPNRPGTNSVDNLVRQIRNATHQYRADRRIEELSRINEIIRDVNKQLVLADSRAEIERSICEELTQEGAYVLARVGPPDDATTVRDEETDHPPDLDRLFETVLDGTVDSARVDRLSAEWAPYAAAITIPVEYGTHKYGSLTLLATRERAFDDTERAVLTELGKTVAHALHAAETRETLASRERELQAQNERLENFASVVSHDLRNPLQVATGYLGQLRDDYDDERLDKVNHSMGRIEGIITDVLALARGGEQTVSPTRVSLERVVEAAWNNVDTANGRLETGDLGTLYADENRLVRLFENLFRNAVEHGSTSTQSAGEASERDAGTGQSLAHDDGQSVTVTVEQGDGWFAVEDDGPGIPPHEREDVFLMGHTTGSSGTGFGLAIVDNITDAHGWTVRITDGDDGGARFVFETGPS